MIFSKHRRKISADRRWKSKAFQSKVKAAQNYKRLTPISFRPKSPLMVLFSWRSKFFRVFLGAVLVLIAYFFVFSDYFKISQAEISGNEKVSTEQIQSVLDTLGDKRRAFVPKSNFFLLTRGSFNSALTESHPVIKEVAKYRRIWPNKIQVEIKERNPGFVLRSNDQDYLVDDEGIVVRSAPDQQNLPLVLDQVAENFDLGEPLPNTKMVAFILSAHKQWDSKISTPIAETKIPGKAASEVQFVTKEGWTVFFDTERSVTIQLGNLALILSRQIRPVDRPNLSYIDLRLSKWAYFCYKNTPCVAGAQEPIAEVLPEESAIEAEPEN